MTVLVSQKEFAEFLWQGKFLPSAGASQRLGQAFCYKFFPADAKPDSELFYEENNEKAIDIIVERYLEKGDY